MELLLGILPYFKKTCAKGLLLGSEARLDVGVVDL